MRHVVRLVQFGGVVEDLLKLKMQKLIVHWSCKLHISDFLLSGANLFYNYMRGYKLVLALFEKQKFVICQN